VVQTKKEVKAQWGQKGRLGKTFKEVQKGLQVEPKHFIRDEIPHNGGGGGLRSRKRGGIQQGVCMIRQFWTRLSKHRKINFGGN